MGRFLLGIVLAVALLVFVIVGFVQCVIPGDHGDKNTLAGVELASRHHDHDDGDDDEGDGPRCYFLCEVTIPMPGQPPKT